MYDVTKRDTFEIARALLALIRQYHPYDRPVGVLVGTHSDTNNARQVARQQAWELAMENNCRWTELSGAASPRRDIMKEFWGLFDRVVTNQDEDWVWGPWGGRRDLSAIEEEPEERRGETGKTKPLTPRCLIM